MPGEEENLNDYMPIDEFAAKSGSSTRTIRYYQARGLLQRPTKRGRVALYGPQHAERLEFIEELQSRGLTLRAVKALVSGRGTGNQPVEEWLGLDRLREGWTVDPPTLMSRAQLEELVGDGGAGQISRLLDVGAIELDEEGGTRSYRVSPALIRHALDLERAGVSLAVSVGVHGIIENHFVSAAREAIGFLHERRGKGFGDGENMADGRRAIEALFPAGGSPFVQLVFAQAVDRALGEWLEADGPKQIAAKVRSGRSRDRTKKDKDAAKREKKARKKRRTKDGDD